MGINAIAKKKIGFRNGDTGEVLTVSPFEYVTLPDWVRNDPMYQWAVNDGSLEIPKPEIKPEVPKVDPKPEKGKGKKDDTAPESGDEGAKQ